MGLFIERIKYFYYMEAITKLLRKELKSLPNIIDFIHFTKGFVAIFSIPNENEDELNLGKLSQILNEGGYHVLYNDIA
jgi:hypothetical protein